MSKNNNEIVIGNGVRIEVNLVDCPSWQDLKLTFWQGTEPIIKTSVNINLIAKEDLIALSDFFTELSKKAY